MAYNIAASSANAVPVMGGPFMMPAGGPVLGGNLMVSPANPLGSFVLPAANRINGSVVVPTTSHVIGPAGGLVMAGGFIPPPCNPPFMPAPMSVPAWNPMVDYTRKTAEVVDHLGKLYDGLLRCKKCQHHIAFESKAIFAHDQQCFSNKGISPVQQKAISTPDPRSLSTIDEFEKKIRFATNIVNPTSSPPPIDWMNSFLDQVDRTSFIIKQFDCLSCPKSGAIVRWEEHVLQFHRVELKTEEEAQFELTCICFVCNALLFGTKTAIQKHTHRVADASKSVLISNTIALYPNLLSKNGSLSRYQKFVMKTANSAPTNGTADSKVAFFCSACDFFGFKKMEKHFSSFEHNMHSVVSDDPRRCEVCQIVLSSDALLMAVHRLTPAHLLAAQEAVKMADPWIETSVHQKLMESVQRRFSNHHFDSVAQRLAYCCDICNFATLLSQDWQTHTACEGHQKNVASGQGAEFTCLSCKLTLFGQIRVYLGHMTTKGHKLIKRAVISRYNLQQLQQPQKRTLPASGPSKAVANGSNEPVARSSSEAAAKGSSETVAKGSSEAVSKGSSVVVAKSSSEAVAKGSSEAIAKSSNVSNPSRLSEMLYLALQGDFPGEENGRTADAKDVPQQQPKEVRARKDRCESESRSASTSEQNQRTSWLKVRSESESSVMSPRKSIAAEESKTAESDANVNNRANPGMELRFSKTIVKSTPHSKDPLQKKTTNPVGASGAASNAAQNPEPSKCLLLPTSATSRGNGKSEDDESDSFYDCRSTVSSCENDAEKESAVGGVSSEEENEKDGDKEMNVKNAEEDAENDEDDENDLCDEILASCETDCNPMVSDEELDASVLQELKSDAASGLNEAKVGENADGKDKTADEERVIVRHLIVVRGIPKQALQNKRIMYATFSRFGEIHRTYVKKNEPDSLYILVLKNPEAMFQKLKDNVVLLKKKLGSEEISVEHNTRSTNGTAIRIELLKEARSMFSDQKKLNEAVFDRIQTYENEFRSAQSEQRIRKLEANVAELALSMYHRMVSTRVHIFGSRVTGLATNKSDVDIYLQLGDSFNGCMHTNTVLQQQLVVAFSNKMKMLPKHFQNVISIPFARVPIVKFTDVCSGLNCDLSFKSGLSTMNSILVRAYLSLDTRVKYLVCAVKLWMELNGFADRHLFTTYAQIWMVLFFLMQAEIAVVPTVLKLRLMLPVEQQQFNIEDWNCAFPNMKCIIWRSACTFTSEELLAKFFEFYSNFNLRNYVLCTLTGIKMEKKYFLEFYDKLPPIFAQYRFKVRHDADVYNKIFYDFEGFCVQDPFDHSHNLTKTINSKKFQSLTEVCRETAAILKSN